MNGESPDSLLALLLRTLFLRSALLFRAGMRFLITSYLQYI
jgi:hypothetical protein